MVAIKYSCHFFRAKSTIIIIETISLYLMEVQLWILDLKV